MTKSARRGAGFVMGLVLLLAVAAVARAEPPLVEAAKRGDLAAVVALLAGNVGPDNHDQNRNTALTFAARDGHLDMAEALIAAGATVDWQDGERVTPLILAAHKNHPTVARLLLDQGADPSIRDKWNRTALDYALRRGTNDAIAQMIEATVEASD